MIWVFIKMSGTWYADQHGVEDGMDNIQDNVLNGQIVTVGDDFESVCDHLDIDPLEVVKC